MFRDLPCRHQLARQMFFRSRSLSLQMQTILRSQRFVALDYRQQKDLYRQMHAMLKFCCHSTQAEQDLSETSKSSLQQLYQKGTQ